MATLQSMETPEQAEIRRGDIAEKMVTL